MARLYAPDVVIKLTPTTCCNCGVHFAMDERVYDECLQKGGNFYCPNGHGQHFTEPQLEKAQQRIRALEGYNRMTEERLERERRQHSATKGQLTKTKKRIAGGVCPCCNRSFANVGRHMAGQHPEYVTEAKAA